MKEYEFRSVCDRYSVLISEKNLVKMKSECTSSCTNETGGILIGYYSSNLSKAIITHVTTPTYDSKKNRNSFLRGVIGLKNRLEYYWNIKSEFYIGEWHFHPVASPKPSQIDIDQMKMLSKNRELNCPEPILIILGQNSENIWTVSASVFVDNIVINLVNNKIDLM